MKFYPVFICDNLRKGCRLAGDIPIPYLTKGTVHGVMYDLRDSPAVYFDTSDSMIHGEVYMLPISMIRAVNRRLGVRPSARYANFKAVKVAVTLPDQTQMMARAYEFTGHTQKRLRGGDVPVVKSGDWRTHHYGKQAVYTVTVS